MRIAGLDEAGRGPLAGSVFAAAVILDEQSLIPGLNDSKKLSEKKRNALVPVIQSQSIAWAVAEASVEEIDSMNILQASLLAMRRAFSQIQHVLCDRIFIDGSHVTDLGFSCTAVVGGDACIPAISAASVLAKVARDQYCERLHEQYPEYDFLRHKGYPTRHHLELLARWGVSPVHRRSFAPVKRLLTSE